MLLLRRFLLFLPVLLFSGPGSASAEVLPSVVVTGDPVAPLPTQPGTGLCSTSRSSTSPGVDFPQSNASFIPGLNAFLETPPDASNPNTRVTSVLQTSLDLSNNNSSGTRLSYGDFENAVPGCPSGGCGFFLSDTTTSFATRLRGFLNVTADQVSQPLHFGFYADDAVAFTLYDRTYRSYLVINRPPQLGFATWRTTNRVTFTKPGLYPVEVLYAEVSEHAALEMSMLEGTFTDFERPANQLPVVNLQQSGFRLVTAEMFYQSETGQPSFPELDRCVQCNRKDADTPGNGGCGSGYHCNAAAVCDVCDTARFCGASCSPCGEETPFCVARSREPVCVQCRQGSDCTAPDACHVGVCDAAGTCSFPAVTDGTACPDGTCQAGVCTPPDATPDGGGVGSDGGMGADGGDVAPDGGDVGPDGGGSAPDGGGVGPDGGGSAPDGGGPGDGGSTDGAPDAGLGADAGTDPGSGDGDAGQDGQPGGCGCGAAVPSLAPLAFLGLSLVLNRVRRPRSR
ncbi:outer membrane exchange protein TraA family protein [Archangium violaceum]|uniref:outer membrane exchange protein TraA family protein n=1 Tax=Archangium violaceum TaxID=83451 RepID=UPI002B2AE201|nr:outer membrane exchange protein TraA family protein [Archangium gephyra]